jgi:RNA polymerase sigma factor (sigma-70 family)
VATDSPSDSDLIARTLAGDRGAFEVLVRRHYRAAFSIALAYTSTRADAEDVCHDAFLRAAAKLRECRKPEQFAFWLCAIVRNHARNVSTRGMARRADSLEHETVASVRGRPAPRPGWLDARRHRGGHRNVGRDVAPTPLSRQAQVARDARRGYFEGVLA